MQSDLSLYNTCLDQIVNFSADKSSLLPYIINIPKGADSSSFFSRNTPLGLTNLLAFMIMPRARSTAVELRRFSELSGIELVSKQAFFIKRKYISPKLFEDLNTNILLQYYRTSTDVRMWKGRYLFAVDGTTVTLPDHPELYRFFGRLKNQPRPTPPMANILVIRDVLNGFIVHASVSPITSFEPDEALEAINAMPYELSSRGIFIFDRLYPSASFFSILSNSEIEYVARMRQNYSADVRDFFKSKEKQKDILFKMTNCNWNDYGKKRYEKAGITESKARPVFLHLDAVDLVSGEREVLASNIYTDNLKTSELYWLYGMRWNVETGIDVLKNQLQIEIFSGYSPTAVLQDIVCKIIAFNLGIKAGDVATSRVMRLKKTAPSKNGIRWKINLNIAWSLLQTYFVRIIFSTPETINEILTEYVKMLTCNIERISPGRHNPHNKRILKLKGKYITFTNYKRAI